MKYDSLSQYMEATGERQQDLADKIGISQPHLNQIISGNKRPSPEVAAKIEQLTGVPFRALLLPNEDGPQQQPAA